MYFTAGSLYLSILFTYSAHPSLLRQPLVCSLYLWVFSFYVCLLWCFDSTHKWKHTVFVFPSPAYFTEQNILQVHPSCQNGKISFFYTAGWHSIVYTHPIIFIHSTADGHLGCFHILAIRNSQGFRSSVPETGTKPKYIFLTIDHNIDSPQMPPWTDSPLKAPEGTPWLYFCLYVIYFRPQGVFGAAQAFLWSQRAGAARVSLRWLLLLQSTGSESSRGSTGAQPRGTQA